MTDQSGITAHSSRIGGERFIMYVPQCSTANMEDYLEKWCIPYKIVLDFQPGSPVQDNFVVPEKYKKKLIVDQFIKDELLILEESNARDERPVVQQTLNNTGDILTSRGVLRSVPRSNAVGNPHCYDTLSDKYFMLVQK